MEDTSTVTDRIMYRKWGAVNYNMIAAQRMHAFSY